MANNDVPILKNGKVVWVSPNSSKKKSAPKVMKNGAVSDAAKPIKPSTKKAAPAKKAAPKPSAKKWNDPAKTPGFKWGKGTI